MSADLDELRETLRAFARDYIDDAASIIATCGVVGGHAEIARAEVARALLALLDKMTARPA